MSGQRKAEMSRPTLCVASTAQEQTEALAWLLAILDKAARELRLCGDDIDALVIEAHRAQLAAGREWPGDPIDGAFQDRFVSGEVGGGQ